MSIEICAMIALFALATAVLLAFPLRSGNGEHADAGPGALTVQRLREVAAALPAAAPARLATPEPVSPVPAVPAAAPSAAVPSVAAPPVAASSAATPSAATPSRATPDAPDAEDIAWPEHDWPEHVGRHRLVTDNPIFHRLAMGVRLYIHRHPHLHGSPHPHSSPHSSGCRHFRQPGKRVVFNKPPLLLDLPF